MDARLTPTLASWGWNLAAAYVRCLEAFRPFQQIELNRFALIETAIAIFLNGGEVNKNIFARGALNKPVALGPVEPLYCTLLSHKVLLSSLFVDFCLSSPQGLCLNIPPRVTSAGLNQVMSSGRVLQKQSPSLCRKFSAQARSHFVARVFDDVAQKHQPEFWCIAPNMRQWQKILLRNLPFWQEKIAELNRFLRSVVVLSGF